jgi:anti-sigma28 factor (negative regulator of flagellin synthesis)
MIYRGSLKYVSVLRSIWYVFHFFSLTLSKRTESVIAVNQRSIMKIANVRSWTALLLMALCNRVSVHGFIQTGSELPTFVNAGSRRLETVTLPFYGANRPLQAVSKSNGELFGDDTRSNSNENGVSKQEEEQQEQVSKDRKAQKSKKKKRFASGDELKRLRADLESLRENLHWAEAMEDDERVADLKSAIQNGAQRDPDLCYAKALQMLALTKARPTTATSASQSASPASTTNNLSLYEKEELLEKWQKEADAARSSLPQFQLEGLWVGK